jgi:UDP-N-acetylmuramoyl-tripeptide--D-alanyl-D-alanine ligase
MSLDVAAALSGTGGRVLVVSPDGSRSEQALLPSDLVRAFRSVSIDSRTVGQDDLFVALAGESVDGHEFVSEALNAGARGAIVSRVPDLELENGSGPFYFFVVPDVLAALQSLARYWRRGQAACVIGITGSIGKTTTKDIVAGVLATKWPILASEANLNTEIGLPLMLLRLGSTQRAAVLEMGMYVSGDIKLLAEIAEPDIGVVTTVAPVHLERMKSVEAIAREKSRLIQALPADGLAVLNADDPWTLAMARTSGIAEPVLVGLSPEADYRAVDVEPGGLEGVSFVIRAESRQLPVTSRIPGAHTVNALLTAAAIGRSLGMDWHEIVTALEQVRLESRQRLLRVRPDMLVIDDSYNASPLSMLAALELLGSAKGKKVAILGDMLELGEIEEEAHREIGERVAGVADWLMVRGEKSAWTAEQASRQGFPTERILTPETNLQAIAMVRDIAQRNPDPTGSAHTMRRQASDCDQWAILVKGSRGMRMEEIVQGLREMPW